VDHTTIWRSSSFVVFEADEGGGHAMFWEGPQKYNDSLRTFLRSS